MSLLTGLISAHNFEGNVNDSFGSHHGSATSITYSSGKSGQGAVFNGTSSEIFINSISSSLALATQGTLNIWVNLTSLPSRQIVFYFIDPIGIHSGIYLTVEPSGKLRSNFTADSTAFWDIETSPGTFTYGAWQMITLGHNGIAPYIAVNGVSLALSYNISVSTAKWLRDCITLSSNKATIFGIGILAGFRILGTVDIFTVYNQNRLADISSIYNGGNGNPYPFTSSSNFFQFF